MTEDTENNIRNISIDTAHVARDLHDIAVSLQILSGRTSLKREKLASKIEVLRAGIRHMKNEALLFGDENSIKIRELEAHLEQNLVALDAEEERIFNEINK
jgi:5-carboxymethyl-2-hydroxymuconate isomerase